MEIMITVCVHVGEHVVTSVFNECVYTRVRTRTGRSCLTNKTNIYKPFITHEKVTTRLLDTFYCINH